MNNKFKLIELFSGMGTVTQALKELDVDFEVIATSEIDKWADLAYTTLHGDGTNLGDITQIKELPQADMWLYSFPCQDLSIAGKLEGIKEGTRSGLLYEVIRLLEVAQKKGTLPKYLLMENVKNLVGKTFIREFDKTLDFLKSLGYSNYWKIVNSKDYIIPQHRERVFVFSIRGEHEFYHFPKPLDPKLRLRDMLDRQVEERWYVKDGFLLKKQNSTYNTMRDIEQDLEGNHRTITARDYKDPTLITEGQSQSTQVVSEDLWGTHIDSNNVQLEGELRGGTWEHQFRDDRVVHSGEGTISTLLTKGEGKKVLVNSPEQLGSLSGGRWDGSYEQVRRVYDGEGISTTITTRSGDEVIKIIENNEEDYDVQIAAMRGRNRHNPDRKGLELDTRQQLELGSKETSNTITTVQKDNYVVELVPFGSYYTWKDNQGNINTQCNRAVPEDGYALTVATANVGKVLEQDGRPRVRKITPWEALRLQGWRDKDINKLIDVKISNTQLYKLAGNGITVTVMIALMGQLLDVPWEHILENWDYRE